MNAAERDDDSDRVTADEDSVDRVAVLEARVRELGEIVTSITERLSALEQRPPASSRTPAPLRSGTRQAVPAPAAPRASSESVGAWATVLGRTFLILGGAYLLRALSEAKILPGLVGPAVAFAYAHLWLGLAYRGKAGAGSRLDRTAYGVAFALVAFPLVVEVTTRFHLLTPAEGALGLAVAAAAGLAVSWHRLLRLLAWAVAGMGLLALVVVAVETHAWPAMMLVTVGMGMGVDLVTAHRAWSPLRVTFAAAVDVVFLGLFTPLSLIGRDHYSLLVTLGQLALFAGYMGVYSLRSLLRRRQLDTFERVQLSAVLFIGYVGAVIGALAQPSVSRAIAAASLVLGGAAYAVAYMLFVRRRRHPVEAWFNTSYALVGVLVGSWVLLRDPSYAWMGIAVLLTTVGTRDRYAALPMHGAVFGAFGAIASGLVLDAGYAFAADAHRAWPECSPQGWIALVVVAYLYVAPLERTKARRLAAAKGAKVVTLVFLVLGLGCVVISRLLLPLVDGGTQNADAAWLAALRTGVVVVAALALAAISRVDRFHEARLLVYPLLALGGVKLALEDFPNGSAVTLAVACVTYGAALVFAPRALRRAAPAEAPSPSA